MMDEPFFQPPPPPEPDEEDDEEDYEPKPWHGPPSNVLPGYAALDLMLARTSDVAVFVRGIHAFENGMDFEIETWFRSWEISESLMGDFPHGRGALLRRSGGPGANEIPPERFRLGVQFPDGSKATNTDHGFGEFDEEPTPPTLWERGGGGGGTRYRQGYWVWPLPPAEPFEFVCEWPIAGIPLTRHSVDGALIVEASRRGETLWHLERSGRRVRASTSEWSTIGIAKAEPTDDEGNED